MSDIVTIVFLISCFIGFIVFSCVLVLTVVHSYLAEHVKPLQRFYCRIGWHSYLKDFTYTYDGHGGIDAHCTCKWCGYRGIVDNIGNLR